MNEFNHAQKIVQQFRHLLAGEGIECLKQEHFDELALLIEAAIDSAVLDALEKTADQLERLARETRHRAEQGF